MRKVKYSKTESKILTLVGGAFCAVLGITLVSGGRDTLWGIILLVLSAVVLISGIRNIRN